MNENGTSKDPTVRVRVETPKATFDGSVNNPAEWDALVAFLEHKVRYPMETRRIERHKQQEDAESTDS